MRTADLPVPGLRLGPYPEKPPVAPDPVAGWIGALAARGPASGRRYARAADRVLGRIASPREAGQAELRSRVQALRAAMSARGLADDLIEEALVLACQASAMALGKRPYRTQVIAARILADGKLAEMATGEGKTLATALGAAVAAIAGIPVHAITANDYLVARDANLLRPFYEALGVSVGAVTQPLQSVHRREAYACDVTYCTARELAFDYLRDGLLRSRPSQAAVARPLLRGLCMAVIDEADSVLLDDACVPLVISERRDSLGDLPARALALAATLQPESDFTLDARAMRATLTRHGLARLEALDAGGMAPWRNRPQRDEMVATALAARHLYQKDRHYVVLDGAVALVDETTGRVAAGRAWSHGLQQMVERLEGCAPSPETATTAQITFQRFFQRYLRVCGTSGTLAEARAELQEIYGLQVVPVPLRKPDRRRHLPARLYAGRDALWRAVAEEAASVSAAGRPVLIGTASVAESEALARHFAGAGLAYTLLNARQDAGEARIVAQAGQPGRITITTNMAGRGTDILLAPGTAARGGLHVINCQHNASARIDRQLVGRCARQGDPGSTRTLLAADMPLLAHGLPAWLLRLLASGGDRVPQGLLRAALRRPQRIEEGVRRTGRRALLAADLRSEHLFPVAPFAR